VNQFFSAKRPPAGLQLMKVAKTFGPLQQERHTADYDNAFAWSRANAIGQIDLVRQAFADWHSIRAQSAAQDFLLTLFLPKSPR